MIYDHDLIEYARLAGMTRRERQNEFRRRRRENPDYRARENALARARRARKRGAGGNGAAEAGKKQGAPRQYYDRRFRQWVRR